MEYIDLIKEVLREHSEPKSAKEIADLILKKGHLGTIKEEPITPAQIRIRKDNDIVTIDSTPLTYIKAKVWVLKTVHEDDKASQTIDSYEDRLTEYYNYDNFVANYMRITAGGLAILIDTGH